MSDSTAAAPNGRLERALASVERIGNKLPDPAIIFVIALVVTWIL